MPFAKNHMAFGQNNQCMVGIIATILPKVWFVDRMVWLYKEIKISL